MREVYEHLYETVDATNDPELRASATAKVSNLNGALFCIHLVERLICY